MRKTVNCILTCIGVMVIISGNVALANTVAVSLTALGDLEISGFQILFDESKDAPVVSDYTTSESDFDYSFGSAVPDDSAWEAESLIRSEQDVDYARGVGGYSLNMLPEYKLQDGVLLTMRSSESLFGISDDPENAAVNFQFFDFSMRPLLVHFNVAEEWTGEDQNITLDFQNTPVPLPGTLLLLASGWVGMIGIRRKVRR